MSPRALAARMVDQYAVSHEYAELSIGFLRKVGLLGVQSGVCNLSDVMTLWLRDNDPARPIVALHRGVRLIGEMLAVLDVSMTTSELLSCANDRYQMGWRSTGQIGNRVAWLRSAGFIGHSNKRLLYCTEAGTAFLDLVVLEPFFDHPSVRLASTAAAAGSLGRTQQDTAEHRPRQATYVSWEDRASGVLPMPGGYNGYLDSLRWLAESVEEAPPTRAVIAERMAERFYLTDNSAETRVSFLQKAGFLKIESGGVVLPDFMRSWLRDGDSTHVIVQLHLGVQFVGEMLKALEEPATTAELHRLALEQYSMGWETTTQIDNRRGWLQSAGLMGRDHDGRLYRTANGIAFLELVAVEPPFDHLIDPPTPAASIAPAGRVQQDEQPTAETPTWGSERSSHGVGSVADLAGHIVRASTDTRNPGQFEKAVCEAFGFLGFDAEHLGGSGKTDVLLDARLGRDASYRVTIDAKTTSSPALQDQQVDWVTLAEHRVKHGADVAMLIGPNPTSRRLLERAQSRGIAVLSADALADLCCRHAATPLGLADYKSIFERGGSADLAHIKKRSEEAGRRMELAKWLLDAIGEEAEYLGPRTARDLHGRLYRDEGANVAAEPEIQDMLQSLASPLLGAIAGDSDRGYVLACSPAVTAERLRLLGEALTTGSTASPVEEDRESRRHSSGRGETR